MEKVKDFFGQFRERMSNPFLFSFLCSWIVYNWKVVIAIVLYDPSQIKKRGSTNIYSFIESELSYWTYLVPAFFAIGYTLLFPIIKNLIKVFNAKVDSEGETAAIKYTKSGKISLEKYFGLKNDLDKRTKILEDYFEKEQDLTVELESVKTASLQYESRNLVLEPLCKKLDEELTSSKKFILDISDYSLLNGTWVNEYNEQSDSPTLKGREKIAIENGIYYLGVMDKTRPVFKVKHFNYNNTTNEVFFIKERIAQKNPFIEIAPKHLKFNVNELVLGKNELDETTLKGFENGIITITYTKIAD